MNFSREPRIHPVPILDLRPTQITVGLREVAEKRAEWEAHPKNKKADFLGSHVILAVLRRDHIRSIGPEDGTRQLQDRGLTG